MNRIVVPALLAACSSAPASKPPVAPLDPPHDSGATLGAFAVYVWQPEIDPFPDARSDAGWGVGVTADGKVMHFMVLSAAPDRPADEAIARRAATPKLPSGSRLLYAGSTPYSGSLSWTLSSVVVAADPVLQPVDVAACQIVERANVVIDADANQVESHGWPWVHLTWTPAAVARLKALVDHDAKAKLYLALGDDVVGQWMPAVVTNIGEADVQIPQPDATTAWAYAKRNPQLCPNGVTPPASGS